MLSGFDLSIGGLEMEVVIAVLRLGNFENTCHRSALLKLLITAVART
jgi:hypothetical protein